MTETDYIAATNLCRVRTALALLNEVLIDRQDISLFLTCVSDLRLLEQALNDRVVIDDVETLTGQE